jgi:hypothetical protein
VPLRNRLHMLIDASGSIKSPDDAAEAVSTKTKIDPSTAVWNCCQRTSYSLGELASCFPTCATASAPARAALTFARLAV